MLLERFGLWEARNQRVDSFSRGMLQRLALCRTLLHDPELLVLDEPFNALDEEGAALLDRELAELRPRATFVVATHDPAAASTARSPRGLGVGLRAMSARTSPTSLTLARKDLRLELRARSIVPAMLLFVVVDARRLPLRAAGRQLRPRGQGDALGRDRLHRAPRPDARVRRRARAAPDRRPAPRAVRPERDLAREDDRDARLPRRRRARRAAGVRALLLRDRRRRRSPASRSPTSGSAPSAPCSRRWRSPAARASCSCRCSSCRSRSRSSSAASAPASPTNPAVTWGFSRSTTLVFAIISWASFEYVVTE